MSDSTPTPKELDAFMRAAVISDEMNNQAMTMLEDRIMDLEEIVCAGWPGGVFLARRLRRKIRASIGSFPGATFADRRANAVSTEMALRERRVTP